MGKWMLHWPQYWGDSDRGSQCSTTNWSILASRPATRPTSWAPRAHGTDALCTEERWHTALLGYS